MAAIDSLDSGGGYSYGRRRSHTAGANQLAPSAEPTISGMPGTENNPNTGIGGTPQGTPQPAPNFGSLSAGFDVNKLNDPNKHSFKYDYGRAVAGFDPSKGFTPEVLNALNALGYANFSGGGKMLNISGVNQRGIAAGMDPRDFSGDFVDAFDAHNGATKWGFDWLDSNPTPQQAAYGPDPMAMLLPSLFGGQQSYAPPQPQQPAMPAIFSDANFWQQLVSAMQPQYAPGYSNAPTPNFAGAQYGTSQQPVAQQNPQITQLLSQLFAGLTGGG